MNTVNIIVHLVYLVHAAHIGQAQGRDDGHNVDRVGPWVSDSLLCDSTHEQDRRSCKIRATECGRPHHLSEWCKPGGDASEGLH